MNKYITKDEYLKAKGVDLELELQNDDNHSNKVNRFIHEITDWCLEYLMLNYCDNELLNFHTIPEWRQKAFRDGVMEQIEYVLDNGWLMKDSGFNSALGQIVDLSRITMGFNAQQKFRMGAFMNIINY